MSLGISVHKNLDELVPILADEILTTLCRNPTGIVVLPTGPISLAVYDHLAASRSPSTATDFAEARFVLADEAYHPSTSMSPTNRSILMERFLSPLSIDPSRLRSFDLNASSAVEECHGMDVYIDTLGPVNLFVGEIDSSGRIGRVQPETPYRSRCHVACIPDPVDDTEPLFGRQHKTPCAMTLGLQDFTRAGSCLVSAVGWGAGAAIRRALSGLVSEQLPCGALRFCRSVHLLLDTDAGHAIGDDLLRRFALDLRDTATVDLPPPFFAG
jgi:6-phosphogluconolactonase/glucosamine-6-phosphate isomerase/deaminase